MRCGAIARVAALKALADRLLPLRGRPASDYVLIARHATVERPFADLRRDLEIALARLSGSAGRRA